MNKWTSVKKELPPFYIFVEVIYRPKSRMNDIFRGFCCLCYDESGKNFFWSGSGMDERDSGDFGITHWRKLNPDHLGRTPVLYTTKRGDFKVKMVKLNPDLCKIGKEISE